MFQSRNFLKTANLSVWSLTTLTFLPVEMATLINSNSDGFAPTRALRISGDGGKQRIPKSTQER